MQLHSSGTSLLTIPFLQAFNLNAHLPPWVGLSYETRIVGPAFCFSSLLVWSCELEHDCLCCAAASPRGRQ